MLEWVLAAAMSAAHVALVTLIEARVPEPYMDEMFHVDQTRRYCNGDWWSWNEKITTPPALYILAQFGFCGRERYVNSALFGIAFIGLLRLRRRFSRGDGGSGKLRSHRDSLGDLLLALLPLTLPVLLHSSLLFYTDLLAMTAVVWAFGVDSVPVATVFFAIAVATRQTNIVWAGVYGLLQLESEFDRRRLWQSAKRILRKTWTLLMLAAAFVAFVVWNRGIVLGDRSAHHPVLHCTQPLYFALFAMFSAWPLLIDWQLWRKLTSNWRRRPLPRLVAITICLIIVHFFTMDHPYLMADNRHYTFYVWRRWFRRHWVCPYLLAPVYVVALEIMAMLVSTQSLLHRFALAAGTCAMLVPAHLLECRYFIVPFVVWRLSVRRDAAGHRRSVVAIVELASNCALCALTVFVFLERPFRWPHEPDDWQRFMW